MFFLKNYFGDFLMETAQTLSNMTKAHRVIRRNKIIWGSIAFISAIIVFFLDIPETASFSTMLLLGVAKIASIWLLSLSIRQYDRQ